MSKRHSICISVIIPTLNRYLTLKNTLASYLGHETIPSEIIVVDQSDDGGEAAKKICEEYCAIDQCKISFVYNNQKSLTAARNIGLKMASYDLIIMSDDDIEIFDDTLSSIFDIFKNPSVSMLACDSVGNTKKEGYSGYLLGFKNFFKRKKAYVTKSIFGRYPVRKVIQSDAEWAMGFFFCLRKSICDRGNIYWDENLFGYSYAEDLDFSYRYYRFSKQCGLSVIFDRSIKVNHLVSQEYRIPSRKKILMLVLNRKYLSYKFGMPAISRLALDFTNGIMLVRSFAKKENYKDYFDAIKLSRLLTKKNYLNYSEFGGKYIK